MGTKKNPGKFDCYEKAKDDEPMFVLLARDPLFQELLELWANRREMMVKCGLRPTQDMEMVSEARKCAEEGASWRRTNWANKK